MGRVSLTKGQRELLEQVRELQPVTCNCLGVSVACGHRRWTFITLRRRGLIARVGDCGNGGLWGVAGDAREGVA